MRFVVLACLLVATPALADGLAVQKKVTSLTTKDKLSKIDVLVKVPDVLSCFDKPRTVVVRVVVKAGKVTETTANADAATNRCLKEKFAAMNVTGTFTADVQLIAKPDPRKKQG